MCSHSNFIVVKIQVVMMTVLTFRLEVRGAKNPRAKLDWDYRGNMWFEI